MNTLKTQQDNKHKNNTQIHWQPKKQDNVFKIELSSCCEIMMQGSLHKWPVEKKVRINTFVA
jgi:hypothetical protein